MSTTEVTLAPSRPEDDPRYLPPIAPPSTADTQALQEAIDLNEELLHTLRTKGWTWIADQLEGMRTAAERGLTSVAGVKSLDEMYALRVRLELLGWLLDLQENTKAKLQAAREELERLQGDEE